MKFETFLNNMTKSATMFANWSFFLGKRSGRMSRVNFDRACMRLRTKTRENGDFTLLFFLKNKTKQFIDQRQRFYK